MVAAETLQTLHRMHIQIADLQSRLDRGPRVIATSQKAVDSLNAALEEAKGSQQKARMGCDDKQLQLQEREARVEELGKKLNSCTSNREYQALQERIAADKQANSVLEDEILESLEKLEGIAIEVAQAQEHLGNAESELKAVQERIAQERAGLESEMSRVKGELEELEKTLPADFKAEYKRVASVRGEETLAPVEDNEYCGGCNQKLNHQVINQLLLEKEVKCGSCGTYLYLKQN